MQDSLPVPLQICDMMEVGTIGVLFFDGCSTRAGRPVVGRSTSKWDDTNFEDAFLNLCTCVFTRIEFILDSSQ